MLRCLAFLVVSAGVGAIACSGPATPPPAAPTPPPSAQPSPAPVAATPTATPTPTPPGVRLPQTFRPTGYTARLAIDPAQTTFGGEIQIAGTIREPSAVLWLHGRHFHVSNATATPEGGGAPVEISVAPRGEDVLALTAPRPLAAGAWTLALTYTGEVDDVSTAGMFRQTVAGERYVFSQLEAIYGRRVFPCVDEPDSKVPWQLTLDVPNGLAAFANTPETKRSAIDAGHTRIAFDRTPPLPSYLVAFAVGPFDVLAAGKTKAGVPVRVIVMKGRGPDAAYAVKTTAAIVDVLAAYFGIPYGYPKLDVLSIPVTVGFGAMENAGLVTFTETLMLFDQKHPSAQRQREWLVVASHELAHQWFGDLVTTAWWDDIWLNEGFAEWMQTKAAGTLMPQWHLEEDALDTRHGALAADALTSARKIRQPIEASDDIDNAFDAITYNKGASVLGMFESYLGADVFQTGVRKYIAARANGNATAKDFIEAMSAASGKDLKASWSSFLDQPGAPEITATIRCDAGPRIQLAQQRYVPPGAPAPAGPAQLWNLPVCVAYDQDGKRAEACTVVDRAQAELVLPNKIACPRWVMPNVGAHGYYRLALTAAQVAALRDEAWSQLTWPERREVFSTVETRVATGQLPLALAFSFVPQLLAGGDRFTIGDATGFTTGFDARVPDELRGKYEAYLRATFGAGAARVGLLPRDRDDLDAELTRDELIAAVGSIGRDPALIAEAVRAAAHWRDLPQSARGTVLAMAVDANDALFEKTLHDAPAEPDRSNRTAMYWAVAGVHDVPRHVRALGLLVDPKVDLRESIWLLFANKNEATRDASQQFFREHRTDLLARMPHDDTTGQATAIAGVFTSSCDASRRAEVIAYVHESFDSFPGAKRALAQAIEAMDQCIARRAIVDPQLRAWLQGLKPGKPAASAKPGRLATPAKHP